MSQEHQSIESLQNSLVELLMAIIGLPDDQALAREGDTAVRALDARLLGEPSQV